jgi:hypothetical protein
MLSGKLQTMFGWTVRPGIDPNPRSLRNFPMQANGAEMLRLNLCAGARCQVRLMQELMAKANAIVLGSFELRSDVKIVPSPERYLDPRGTVMWERIEELLSTKHPVPPALSPTSDRAVLQVPPISRPHYRLPAGQGHDGTPPSSKVSRRGTSPVPWHPTRCVLLYKYTL